MDNNDKLIEPIIFDDRDKKPSVKLQKPMDFDVRTKSIEEKLYIILYEVNDDDIDEMYKKCYALCIGRTDAYNNIKEKLISGVNVDIHRSKIITETKQTETETGDKKYYLLPYEECISIYSFCTSVRDYYSYDDFDIENYNDSEVPEDYNALESNPNYLTPEQLDYRKMLDAAIHREKFLADMKSNKDGVNI